MAYNLTVIAPRPTVAIDQ